MQKLLFFHGIFSSFHSFCAIKFLKMLTLFISNHFIYYFSLVTCLLDGVKDGCQVQELTLSVWYTQCFILFRLVKMFKIINVVYITCTKPFYTYLFPYVCLVEFKIAAKIQKLTPSVCYSQCFILFGL